MNSAVLLKISLMLGILITLLLTPAFAQWVYYEFDTAESVQKQYPIQMEEFNYEPQTVTLPGDSEVTTPPEGGDEGGDDPNVTPPVEVGEHHSNLLALLVGRFEDLQNVSNKDFNNININVKKSILERAILNPGGNEKFKVVYSKDNTLSGGNLPNALANIDAFNLEFVITANYEEDPWEIIVYSFDTNQTGETGTRIEVYQSYLKEGTDGRWSLAYSYRGTAEVIDSKNNKIGNTIDYQSFIAQ